MPRNTKKILMVQHASGILDFKFIRKTLKSLGPNDKITVLAIIQKTSDNKGKQDVKEKIDEYSKCSDIAEIRKLARARQVEFNVTVEAGSLNAVANEYAKKFEATRVHLPWTFSIMQEEEQNQEYSSHDSLVETLLLDKLADFVSSEPQLSPTMAVADFVSSEPQLSPTMADRGMTYNPSALRQAMGKKSKTHQAWVPGQKKGRKRHWEVGHEHPENGPSESSRARVTSPGKGRTVPAQPTPQGIPRGTLQPRATPIIVDLEDEDIPLRSNHLEDHEVCYLVPSIIEKYRGDLGPNEGVKMVENLLTKALSIVRGLSLKGRDESQKMAGLLEEFRARKKRISDLEVERALLVKERDEAKNELYKARDEVGVFCDEAEELKLELERAQKDFEGKLVHARDVAIEDFKLSEEFNALKGEYALGSYFHALKEARAFMRSRPEAKPEDFKGIPKVAEDLELSEFNEATDDQDFDVEGDDADEDYPSSTNDLELLEFDEATDDQAFDVEGDDVDGGYPSSTNDLEVGDSD